MSGEKPVAQEYLEALLIAILFATFARTFVVQAFKIPSGSMEQNLLVGDHILVNKFIYGPAATPLERWLLPQRPVRRGDVVVFKFPEDPSRDFIKRCVGLPGDQVELADKELVINGQPVDDSGYTYHIDPIVLPSSRFYSLEHRYRDNLGPEIIPSSEYFCLGDNRDNSNDSRAWGNVPEDHIKGRALMIYWSFQGTEPATEGRRLLSKVHRLTNVVRNFFSNTRWKRTFRIVK